MHEFQQAGPLDESAITTSFVNLDTVPVCCAAELLLSRAVGKQSCVSCWEGQVCYCLFTTSLPAGECAAIACVLFQSIGSRPLHGLDLTSHNGQSSAVPAAPSQLKVRAPSHLVDCCAVQLATLTEQGKSVFHVVSGHSGQLAKRRSVMCLAHSERISSDLSVALVMGRKQSLRDKFWRMA